MNLLKNLTKIIVVLALAACAGITLNDQAATTLQTVTTARKASTQLMVAGKITKAQDEAFQEKLDTLVASLKAATTQAQLDAAKAQIADATQAK